jgi:peptidoglycan/LPS O-acetylase OafA/YrhL
MLDKSKHLTEIDYLRGLAILLTLIAHFAFMQVTPSPVYVFIINHIAQFWGGVILFFTISGFVITRSFMESFDKNHSPEQRHFKFACKLFYLRRCYRIFPTSSLWILLTILFSLNFNKFGSFGTIHSVMIQAFAALFFVYNALTPWIVGPALSIFWSLSFEEQFYLIFPFLVRLDFKLKMLFLLGIIISFCFIHRPPDQTRLINSFPLDAICYGVLIALLHKNKFSERIKPSFLENKQLSHINFYVSVITIILSPILFKKITCGTSILVLAGAWLVFCASYGNGYISLNNKVLSCLRVLGRVSFSLYCCHMSAYLIAKECSFYLKTEINLNSFFLNIFSFIVAMTLCTVFTCISYFLIEKKSRDWGRSKTQKILELKWSNTNVIECA